MKNVEVRIADFLSHGRSNAKSLRELCAMLGMEEREVRKKIQRERLAGVPVLSDNATGYFLPESMKDIEAFAQSMRRRAGEICRVADAVESGGVVL